MPPSFAGTFVRHPRKSLLRRAMFQVHLWAGLLLSLYVVALALTGSVLVFRSELERASLPQRISAFVPGKVAPIQTVLAHFKATFPASTLVNLQLPSASAPVFGITGSRRLGSSPPWPTRQPAPSTLSRRLARLDLWAVCQPAARVCVRHAGQRGRLRRHAAALHHRPGGLGSSSGLAV